MNPLLSREIRARFRDNRAFALLFVMVAGLSLFFAYLYSEVVAGADGERLSALSGREIFAQLAWMQTLGWLLIAPALTSSSIAYERERGWFDSLLLSRLSPRAIVLGKWVSALLFAAILTLVTLPLMMLIFLLGGVSLRQFFLVAVLHATCAMCGAAIGIATSAWSPRANTALRTAYGLIFIGFIASLYGAASAGELPFRFLPAMGTNTFWMWLGRTNPVLRSVEITGDLTYQRVGVCLAFLGAATLFFLWAATVYARQALQEAPFIQKKASKKAKKVPRSTHGEIPLVTHLRFANPVLDREVRAKFRLRQPPLAVIVVEIVLAILVAGFYARTLYWAFFEPSYRELIWWGLCFTGLIVSMMSASIMGSNGFSREREGGTWEGVRLSLLSPGEILSGKVFASLFTCALFSLPVWPLLLPCVEWSAGTTAINNLITRADVVKAVAIWLCTVWSYTLIGLWIGRRAPRTSRASGQTLGVLVGYLLLSPFVFAGLDSPTANTLMEVTHPLIALANVASRDSTSFPIAFCLTQFGFGLMVWFALAHVTQKELRRGIDAA